MSTPVGEEGWTSSSSASACASGSITTFSFICNSTATTTALVQASARVFADPTQCQYIVQLQTSLACQSTNNFLPSPSSGFGGLGYDLGALTGYDMFAAESGNYNGQFSYISFCITILNGSSTSWAYAARGTAVISYTAGSATVPSGVVVIASLLTSVLSSANGSPDVQFTLSSMDGGDNLLNLAAGSTSAYPDSGGITISWPQASAANGVQYANLYQSGGVYAIDSFDGPWVSASFTITAQYYNPSSPSVISCATPSAPQAVPSAFNPNQVAVVPYYYYINLAGTVRDPTCQQYAPGSMVCQRWVPNVCSDTAVAAVWSPSTSTPSWTYINGANYSSGIQLSLLSAPPLANTRTGVSQVVCNGTMVRLQFTCSSSSLRPYIASSYKSVSANNACAFTFIIGTYLLCAAPGQTATAPSSSVANCAPSINGYQYNLAPLASMDISAYDSGNNQYVLRTCGAVANGFGQGTLATYQSSLIAVPVVCSSTTASSGGTVYANITSVAGSYPGAAGNWSALSSGSGLQLTQATGQSCTATCNGAVVYSGPWTSVTQYVCSTASTPTATASVGSYDGSCHAINGGSCTLTFVTQTSSACQVTVSAARSAASLSQLTLVGLVLAALIAHLSTQ